MNDTIRKQQAVSLLNALAPLVGTVIDPTALAVHVLKTGFDIKDPERFIMQQGPPMPPEGAGGAPPMQGPSDMVPPPPGAPVGASPDGAFNSASRTNGA